jgi:hypothetical protein
VDVLESVKKLLEKYFYADDSKSHCTISSREPMAERAV